MMSEGERDQRLRDINRRLREILSERAMIEEKWHGNIPADASNHLGELQEEQTLLRLERMDLQAPQFTPEMAKAQITLMWDMVNGVSQLMRRLIWWLVALSAVELALIGALLIRL